MPSRSYQHTKPKTSNSLRRYRKAMGLRQKDVAEILELKNTSMISRWERGIFLPNTINAFKLAIIYRTMTDALFVDFIRALKSEVQEREDRVLRDKQR